MNREAPQFEVGLARSQADLHAAQRLRYEVFVAELGGGGPMVDHDARLERDRFDPFFDHLLLRDRARPEGAQVVGVYRLLDDAGAARAGSSIPRTNTTWRRCATAGGGCWSWGARACTATIAAARRCT